MGRFERAQSLPRRRPCTRVRLGQGAASRRSAIDPAALRGRTAGPRSRGRRGGGAAAVGLDPRDQVVLGGPRPAEERGDGAVAQQRGRPCVVRRGDRKPFFLANMRPARQPLRRDALQHPLADAPRIFARAGRWSATSATRFERKGTRASTRRRHADAVVAEEDPTEVAGQRVERVREERAIGRGIDAGKAREESAGAGLLDGASVAARRRWASPHATQRLVTERDSSRSRASRPARVKRRQGRRVSRQRRRVRGGSRSPRTARRIPRPSARRRSRRRGPRAPAAASPACWRGSAGAPRPRRPPATRGGRRAGPPRARGAGSPRASRSRSSPRSRSPRRRCRPCTRRGRDARRARGPRRGSSPRPPT